MATPTIKWYYYDSTQWVDISAYVLVKHGCSARWGMQSNKYTDRLARAGEMTLGVKNPNGEFDPDDVSVLAGWGINTKIKFEVTYDGIVYRRFYGYVEKIKFNDPSEKEHEAYVTIKDWMDYAYKRTLTESSIETYRRGGYAVDKVVDAVGVAPLSTQYSEGDYEFEAIFDSLTTTTKAATELNKIVLSENGYLYNRHDKVNGETLVFEAESYRNGLRTVSQLPKLTADCGFILKAGSATDHVLLAGTTDKLILNETQDAHINGTAQRYSRTHGENILNSITVTAYPKRVDTTEQTLYSLGTPIKISSGETKTITVKYQNKDTKESCNAITDLMIQPVATTDYTMNTKMDGTGTDITSSLTVSVVYHTASADVTLTNASAYTGKITKLELRGYGVYQDSEIKVTAEDATSITDYGNLELNIKQQYQRDTATGAMMANKILQKEKDPRTRLDRVQMVANTSSVHMLAFLNVDVGDMVKVTESVLGLVDYYYVQGIDFDIIDGSVIVFTWLLVDVLPSVALGARTLAAVEFTRGKNMAVVFENIQQVYELKQRTIIFSVNPASVTSTLLTASEDNDHVLSIGALNSSLASNVPQSFFSISLVFVNPDNVIKVKDYGFKNGATTWLSDGDTNIPTNEYTRVCLVYNKYNSALNIPEVYINSTKQGWAGITVAGGDQLPETDTTLIVGGYKNITADAFASKLNGVIKNVLIYNRILSAAEIALDAAGTLITNGLVFRGLCIQTADTATYYDAALAESQILYDDINGAIGVPHGAPTCREIT